MHELPVTESILEISLRAAQAQNARRISDIYLKIGQWSTIVDDSIQFYWDTLSEGTLAQGATLHFERIPTLLLCLDCAHSYHPTGEQLLCPQCGSARLHVHQGEEFQVESIEIETDESP
jgi:hydrogenase nickel incorporation protein HypA/HybF